MNNFSKILTRYKVIHLKKNIKMVTYSVFTVEGISYYTFQE